MRSHIRLDLVRGYPNNQWDFRVYYHAARAWADGVNPYVLFPLVQDVSDLVAKTYAIVVSPTIQTMVYGLIVLVILAIAWRVARRIDAGAPNRIELILYLVLLTFAITTPRLKLYAYMLVIVPT